MDDALFAKLPAFNADVHPELMFRMALMGFTKTTIAEAIGIPPQTLDRWVSQHPAMQQAITDANQADSKVVASLYYEAIGWDQYEQRPKPKGANVQAALAWLKHRQRWQDEPKTASPIDKMTIDQVRSIVQELEQRMSRRPPPAAVLPATVVDPNDDPEF